APTGVSVPWTVPIFINGILATNSILGGVLQLVDIAIVGVLWFPFLKLIDRSNLNQTL
ncbi:MAG: oligo-beta-mannoside permease IIC protein, partial [Carnobacterium sp.]